MGESEKNSRHGCRSDRLPSAEGGTMRDNDACLIISTMILCTLQPLVFVHKKKTFTASLNSLYDFEVFRDYYCTMKSCK